MRVRIELLAALCLAACTESEGGSSQGSSTSADTVGSSSGSAPGTSAGTTGAQASGATTSGGSGTGTSGGSGSGNATTGTTTGAPPPVFVDGGYVSCILDAGSDGGSAFWNCAPGTYFCDLNPFFQSCFQCRSDADCADQSLPTYDPRKPHCDNSSRLLGDWHFCQECVSNADCAGNPNGSYCDLNTAFQQPSIETVGFETCNGLVNDCRVDGGPVCNGLDQYCDPDGGDCLTRSGACQSDADCAGYLSPTYTSEPQPYCSDAGACNSCPGGFCPNGYCVSDADCGNGQTCDREFSNQCSCSDDSQCTGLSPSCIDRDGSRIDDAGQILGFCGCDGSAECGDAGQICLPAFGFNQFASCGLSCASPDFPSCYAATGLAVCDVQSESCEPCVNDLQCRRANDPRGPRCDSQLGGPGNCGCRVDQDCPTGEVCPPAGNYIGACTPALPRCTSDSCSDGFCNWESGLCVQDETTGGGHCVNDFDCASSSTPLYTPTCLAGTCGCQSNADCVRSGAAARGDSLCCLPGGACVQAGDPSNTCVEGCSTDADCIGNGNGSGCVGFDGGASYCGCGLDADCAGNAYGHHCERDAIPGFVVVGFCGCTSDGDCPSGQVCPITAGEAVSFCSTICSSVDGGFCAPGYFCDPGETCRPRCDDGNQCQGNDTACDSQNVAGQNGAVIGASAPGVTWCYSCLSPSDCPSDEGCDPALGCGHCSTDANCPAGTACLDGGFCQPSCLDAPCPDGGVCDVHGLAGLGANVCVGCVSPANCPDLEGCNSQTHTCGTCLGPTASGYPDDCPPDAICSNYWSRFASSSPSVCLANCDRTACPAGEPICAVYPGLTPDHKYCFGCLTDSDCGPNQRCNLSPNPTFTCVDGP